MLIINYTLFYSILCIPLIKNIIGVKNETLLYIFRYRPLENERLGDKLSNVGVQSRFSYDLSH